MLIFIRAVHNSKAFLSMDEEQQQCYKPYSHIIMYLKLISQDNFKYLKYQHAFSPVFSVTASF